MHFILIETGQQKITLLLSDVMLYTHDVNNASTRVCSKDVDVT